MFLEKTAVPFWKKLVYTHSLAEKSVAKKVAFVAVATALCIATNCFEIKFATVQFSLTVFSSVLAGILVGPLFGATAVFIGDMLGYLVNSAGYPYYWWVALSCAMTAVVAGLVMLLPLRFKGGVYYKLAIICYLTLFVCSVLINSTGMYYIGLRLYMPSSVKRAFEERFGGRNTFVIYLAIRYFILGQIWNSLVNYALLFLAIPALQAIKPLGLNFD